MDSTVETGAKVVAANRITSWTAGTRRVLKEYPVIPILVFAVMVFVAIFGDILAPHDPIKIELEKRLKPPSFVEGGSTENLLGTDHLGRDLLSRVLSAAKVSLIVGLASVLIAGVFGTILALAAGYFRGWVDTLISRVVDMMFAMPPLLVALTLGAILGASLTNIILIVSLTFWARYTRLLRGQVMQLREMDFTKMATISGSSHIKILLRHLLPNIGYSFIVLATLQLGTAIIFEASLSFLGLGVPPPAPAWGSILAEGRDYIATAWWLCFFPGIALSLTVLSVNLIGDWIGMRLDPRFRQRKK